MEEEREYDNFSSSNHFNFNNNTINFNFLSKKNSKYQDNNKIS